MPEMITTDTLPSAQFKMMTGMLRAATGDDGVKRLTGVASSTTKDLHGDSMAESAIMSMEQQANQNLTIFMNHKYDVPEDVFGSVESATAMQRGMDGEGNPNWDLSMTIVVDDDNPRAEKTYNAIQKGRKLGLSIGAMIPEGGATREKDTGALIINDLTLLETSVVSIPANPRSWIQNAVKALHKAEASPTAIEVPVKAMVTVEETKAQDICEGCGGSKKKPQKDCLDDFHSAKSVATNEEVETADKAVDQSHPEEAPAATPAEDDAEQAEKAAEPEEDDEGIAVAMAHVQSVDKVLEAVTAKLADMTDKLASEKRARKDAERQRDEAVESASTVVEEVRSIMERVGQTPVGRKTQFVDAKKDFDHLAGIYSEPFRKMLSQGERK